ncbi:hypothetical protein Acsp02_71410 [Actinoplanes sp. NBRC 103695]|nr:EAL domain-containing protein [Actinoplanes sp. NBRC 103695]GLY99888.1 hypothetical protein Acsp02_71410 [Actinoplanes sp. NBRC 103695]
MRHLAGLKRRREFQRELDARVRTASDGQPVVMLTLGLNDLRGDIRVAFGTAAGDAVMGELATRLTGLDRLGWRVTRIDEGVFAALAPASGAGPDDPVTRLISVLTDPAKAGQDIRVQLAASVGVASWSAGPASGPALLRGARSAMHTANSGHWSWALYDASARDQAGDRSGPAAELRVAELRVAIAAGQLEVHYQPIVDLRTGQAVSVEALVRMRHPVRGLVPPAEFIDLAERYGLISAVTTVVLDTVAEQAHAWARAGRSLPCAVNLSVVCLVDPAYCERLVTTLAALTGLVTVEVTESAMADERAITVLRRLAAAGVECQIDDFGTGYSCLASLKGLPATVVKIDRAFIADIETDVRDLAIVKAILNLANELGLNVIAEGIETQPVVDLLLAAGVVRGQGYWFARPMPAADLDAWLDSRPVATENRGPAPSTGTAKDTTQVLLDGARALLRVDSVEQAVGVLMRAVSDLGGATVPAMRCPADAIPIDVSLGEADPLLPVAPVGSPARHDLERLLPRLVEDARTAADRATRLARLTDQVDTDPLTGLGNRRGLARVRKLHDADSIAMVDLDHFKQVNDTYGHAEGDRILVAFSRAMRQHLRSSDLVFRLGGEEFLLIMPATTPEGVLKALENLRRRWHSERMHPVTFSAGVTAVEAGDLSTAVLSADIALYAAKQAGRDRFELASRPGQPELAVEVLST